MSQLTDADLPTTETREISNENTIKESEDHEVHQASSSPDGAKKEEDNINNVDLALLDAVWLRIELLEVTPEGSSTDPSTNDNANETSPKCGIYKVDEDIWRAECELNVEQWERLRAVLCTDSSLAFPIPARVSRFLMEYKKSGDASAWFENLLIDIDSLAALVKEGSQAESVASFPPIRTIVDVPSSAEFFFWDLFRTTLRFSKSYEHPKSFKLYIKERFYGPIQSSPDGFSITLTDIIDAGLEVEGTEYLDEHFEIFKDKVKIFTPQWGSDCLDGYSNNRIATALGIQTLGSETYTSLNVLYELSRHNYKSNLIRKAQSLYIMPESFEEARKVLLLLENQHAKPEVLSSRVALLQREINYRTSWWPSLKRDMQRNRREQPYFFWGTLLAVFFGTSTIIQTVASIISCYYAIVTYRATGQP